MKKTVLTPTAKILTEFKAVLRAYIDPGSQEMNRVRGEDVRLYSKLNAFEFCLIALGVTSEEINDIVKEAHKNK